MFSMLTACPGARQLHSMEPSVPRTAQTAHWELHSTHGCKGSKNPSEKKPKSQGKRIMVGNNVKKSPDVRGTLELELWKGKAPKWTEFMSLGMRAETSATPANCPLGWQELVTDPITLISIPHTKPLMCTSASTTGSVDHGYLSYCRGTGVLQAFWHKASLGLRSKASWVPQHCVCVHMHENKRETQRETKS